MSDAPPAITLPPACPASEDFIPPYGKYHEAFNTLAAATDDLSRALTAWHQAMAEAEAAWEKIPKPWGVGHHPPKSLSPKRNPAVRGALRPPEDFLGQGAVPPIAK